MTEFILLMHDDAAGDAEGGWQPYLGKLQRAGVFEGGSAIGEGACFRKVGAPAPVTTQVVGYIRVEAKSLEEATSLLAGNPVYEAGGTVEIRELPHTDE